MRLEFLLPLLFVFAALFRATPLCAAESPSKTPSRLCVLWTSADPEVAHNVCFMYTAAAKKAGWFDEVHLAVWGPSQKLLVKNKDLQAEVKAMAAAGVVVEACASCAKRYGLEQALKKLGLEVRGMGKPLSDRLNGGWKVLTF